MKIILVTLMLIIVGCSNTPSYKYEYVLEYTNGKNNGKVIEVCHSGYYQSTRNSYCEKAEDNVGDYICTLDGTLYYAPKGTGGAVFLSEPIKQMGYSCKTYTIRTLSE